MFAPPGIGLHLHGPDQTLGRLLQLCHGDTGPRTTRQAVELRLQLHVYPVLGCKMLAQIKPSTVQAWLGGLPIKSGSYRRVIFANVSTILSAAVDDERIAKNPCKVGSVTPPNLDGGKVVPWPGERVQAVRNALPQRFNIAATPAAGLGLRQGEVFGLSPDDVDVLRGVVEVLRQVRLFAGNRHAFSLPMGNKARTVPLPNSVSDSLAVHLAEHPARLVTWPWRTLDGDPVTVPLVLTTRETTALNRNYFNTRMEAGAASGSVQPSRENGMHALHYYASVLYASVLLDAGESIKP